MPEIQIKHKEEFDDKWRFLVRVTEDDEFSEYRVTLDKIYWQDLTSNSSYDEEDLIIKSFEFLLERESRDAILGNFNLTVISTYFPEYEKTIKERSS